MYLYQSRLRDPYFNIAAEEYFLKNFDEDFFYLYINEPSIIVGKHQNTIAEINVPFVYENGINVVRRLSGGGTVFHDSGNLNYCFINRGAEGHLVDFAKYAQPILDTLKGLGVNAYLKGKSDLVIDDLKFSGNAEHVYRQKVLHHGTMLFASELNRLNEAIKADWSKFKDRAVRSNRSKVTNILNHLAKPLSIDEFRVEILNTVLANRNDIEFYLLSDADERAINKLVEEKYGTWEWNFGYSPNYEFSKVEKTSKGELKIDMAIKKGVIEKVNLLLNGESFNPSLTIEKSLQDTPHHYLKVKENLQPFFEYNANIPVTFEEVLKAIF
ncbi:MAG: lipoate--protein ligase [Salinivirgaceae bacterium]|jgi:lipoate-protein ligase A|nr:lipoate--protein ligase [Salinivirgaceae bacterium]